MGNRCQIQYHQMPHNEHDVHHSTFFASPQLPNVRLLLPLWAYQGTLRNNHLRLSACRPNTEHNKSGIFSGRCCDSTMDMDQSRGSKDRKKEIHMSECAGMGTPRPHICRHARGFKYCMGLCYTVLNQKLVNTMDRSMITRRGRGLSSSSR